MKGPRSSFLDKESAVVVCREAFNLIQGIFLKKIWRLSSLFCNMSLQNMILWKLVKLVNLEKLAIPTFFLLFFEQFG